jgi:hypothetical protein
MAEKPEANSTDEIEVTPEMIEAGEAILANHYLGDGVYDVSAQVISEMYRAMCLRRS